MKLSMRDGLRLSRALPPSVQRPAKRISALLRRGNFWQRPVFSPPCDGKHGETDDAEKIRNCRGYGSHRFAFRGAGSRRSAGAERGAAEGSAVGGPVGGAVGGVVGGVAGGIGGLLGADQAPRFHDYVIREQRSSYRYDEDPEVGMILPSTAKCPANMAFPPIVTRLSMTGLFWSIHEHAGWFK
jgi:hypothetical protein